MGRIGVVFSALALAACATAYQPEGLSGGFSETQLDTNVFRVSFIGNGYTRAERAADFTLLRSADLALKNGFTHFAVIDGNSSSQYNTMTTPSTTTTSGSINSFGNSARFNATSTTSGGHTFIVSKPSSTNTIVCFKRKPEGGPFVYDAHFVFESLSRKYGLNGYGK